MNKIKRGRKPFPWTCSRCRQRAVYDGVTNYETSLEFEGRTYRIKIPNLKTPRCRNCDTVLIDSEADEKIIAAFFRKAKLLTADKIRRYRERLGIETGELAAALGIGEETMARLESGLQFPDRSQDNLLRLFFGSPEVRDILTQRRLSKIGLVTGRPSMIPA